MARVLIVTGPDYLGKSWLINNLDLSDYQVRIRKLETAPNVERSVRISWAQREQKTWGKLGNDTLVVYDRFPYPDEAVYGHMTPTEVKAFEDFLFEGVKGCFLVVLPSNCENYVKQLSKSRDKHLAPFAGSIIPGYE